MVIPMLQGVTVQPEDAIQPFLAAMARGDIPAAVERCHPDVRLESPITDRFAFSGRDQLRDLFSDVHATVSGLRYRTEGAVDAHTWLVRCRFVVGRVEADELLVIRLAEDGLIERIEIAIRPMPALVALAAGLAPRIARRRGRGHAALAAALTRPMAVLVRGGEGLAVRLTRPV